MSQKTARAQATAEQRARERSDHNYRKVESISFIVVVASHAIGYSGQCRPQDDIDLEYPESRMYILFLKRGFVIFGNLYLGKELKDEISRKV